MATQLILLTATEKNGVAYSGDIAVDVADITAPITAVSANVSLVTVRKDWNNNRISDNVNVDVWTVSHSLADIAAMDASLLVVSITKRVSAVSAQNFSTPVDEIFYLPSIIGPVEADGATGSKFLFHEQGNPNAVQYFTNVTPSAFVAGITSGITGTITAPYIPYASAAGVLSDSWLQRTSGGITIQTGKAFSTSTPGKTEIAFGVGGDQFDLSTDGGFNAETRLLINPTSFSLGADGGTNYVAGSSAGVTLFSSTLLSVASPLTVFQASALVQSFTNLTTIDFGGLGNQFFVTTDNGVQGESYIDMTTTYSEMGSSEGFLNIGDAANGIEMSHSQYITLGAPAIYVNNDSIIQTQSNLATIQWGAGGDSFIFTTDGLVFNRSYLRISETECDLVFSDGSDFGGISIIPGSMSIQHDNQMIIECPDIRLGASGDNITVALNTYVDDAAAGAAGLTPNQLYILTATRAITAKA